MPEPKVPTAPSSVVFVAPGENLPPAFPSRKPNTARRAGSVCWSFGPGNSRRDVYWVSGDRARERWILWVELAGEEGSAVIGAYCLRVGLTQRRALPLLLLAFWAGEEARAGDDRLGAPGTTQGSSLIGDDALRGIVRAVWHEEVA